MPRFSFFDSADKLSSKLFLCILYFVSQKKTISICVTVCNSVSFIFQGFDAVGWATGMASGLYKFYHSITRVN